MRGLFQLVVGGFFIFLVSWYVGYKSNPAKICTYHHDKELASKYLRCWPGVDIPLDSFINGHNPVERKKFFQQLNRVEKAQ